VALEIANCPEDFVSSNARFGGDLVDRRGGLALIVGAT
jgi:hypothetical protein